MNNLPHRLTEEQSVVFHPRRDDGLVELRDEVERGYVHVRFTETRGGTELGFPVDAGESTLDEVDWSEGSGLLHLEGLLNLDGVAARCIVDLDIGTLAGKGRLELSTELTTDQATSVSTTE